MGADAPRRPDEAAAGAGPGTLQPCERRAGRRQVGNVRRSPDRTDRTSADPKRRVVRPRDRQSGQHAGRRRCARQPGAACLRRRQGAAAGAVSRPCLARGPPVGDVRDLGTDHAGHRGRQRTDGSRFRPPPGTAALCRGRRTGHAGRARSARDLRRSRACARAGHGAGGARDGRQQSAVRGRADARLTTSCASSRTEGQPSSTSGDVPAWSACSDLPARCRRRCNTARPCRRPCARSPPTCARTR